MVLAAASSSVGEPFERRKGLVDGNSTTEVPTALSRPRGPAQEAVRSDDCDAHVPLIMSDLRLLVITSTFPAFEGDGTPPS